MQIVFSLLLYDLVAIIKSYDITWRLHISNTPLPAALFIIACFNDVLCLLILNICVFFSTFVFNETIDFHWLMFKFKVFPISRSLLRGMGT